jgi:hypothetical protein
MSSLLSNISIKSLYTYALAEGEGVGTAYEYFAKRLALGRWMDTRSAFPRPQSMLVAGLPQKYGSSFDFWLLAEQWGAKLTIVDDREAALEKAKKSFAEAQKMGILTKVSPTFEHVADWEQMSGKYNLCVSSEVLQRMPASTRPKYIHRLQLLAPHVALFSPNKDNKSHVGISGLDGLELDELQGLTNHAGWDTTSGYIDMPPFPPGITRTDDQREQATSGKMESIAMWGLGIYARMEWGMPAFIRRTQSHIVYAFMKQR